MKRLISLALTAAMLITAAPAAKAVKVGEDIENHWAKKYIEYLHDEGVINPNARTGQYNPGAQVTRAEFMRYINRAFHFDEMADISFSDVARDAWYYDTVRIAVKYGYIAGMGGNKMDPNGLVTREQAAAIIGRIYKADNTAVKPSELSFTDRSKINSWSAGYIYDANKKGYIVGYTDGSFRPGSSITRAEVCRILYSYLGSSMSKENRAYLGTDMKKDTSNVTISEACTLTDATVDGDVYVTEGVGDGVVRLNNVRIGGKLITSGGIVELSGVTAKNMIIGNLMGREVRAEALGNTSIASTAVCGNAAVCESDLDISAGGFSDVTVEAAKRAAVSVDADLWTLKIDSPADVVLVSGSSVTTLTGNAETNITGGGDVEHAVFQKNGGRMSMEPRSYELSDGVTAEIAGRKVHSEIALKTTPEVLTIDRGKLSSLKNSYDFSFNVNPGSLDRMTCEGDTLKEGTDYRALDKGVRLYRTFLTRLDVGNYELMMQFADGAMGRLKVKVIDSSKNAIDRTEALFDKYPRSKDYRDAEFTIQAASGNRLESIRLAGRTLVRGEDYSYDQSTGAVRIMRSALERVGVGSSTISFVMTSGGDLSAMLSVVDTTPINTLSVKEVDFDANNQSSGYTDISVKLNAVDGAQLEYITVIGNGKRLEKDWQYVVNGDTIKINRAALQDLAKEDVIGADLRFVMSKGESPRLRVNFVTTYAAKIKIIDDLGQMVSGAEVKLAPVDGDSGASAPQSAVSNASGYATLYVKKGAYTVTVSGDRFETITQKLTVGTNGASQTIRVVVVEKLDVYVTDAYGAMIADATVMLDGKEQTTGSSGAVSFRVPHGSYMLKVSASGYQGTSETITVENSRTLRIRLSQ